MSKVEDIKIQVAHGSLTAEQVLKQLIGLSKQYKHHIETLSSVKDENKELRDSVIRLTSEMGKLANVKKSLDKMTAERSTWIKKLKRAGL